MPSWRDGLVETFPVPEDRRPGYNRRKRKVAKDAAAAAAAEKAEIEELEDALEDLTLSHIPSSPFRFFDLPSEVRNLIYDFTLFSKPAYRGAKGRRKASRLSCLLANHKMHAESTYILYSTTRFPLFFLQSFESPPLLSELAPLYLPFVANLRMTVGPSWTDPPKTWRVTRQLTKTLKQLTSVQTLRVFVEFDPSHPAFAKYRRSYGFYTDFCGDLLGDVLEGMPQLKFVELDGNPGVDVNGPLVRRLRGEAVEEEKEVRWGKVAAWAHRQELPQ